MTGDKLRHPKPATGACAGRTGGMRLARCLSLTWLVAASVVGLASCANATGPPFSALALRPNESVVYIYKRPGQIPAAVGLALTIDGLAIGELRNGGYVVATLAPGAHTLAIDGAVMVDSTPTYGPLRFEAMAATPTYIDVLWVANADFFTLGTSLYVAKGPDLVTFSVVPEAAALGVLKSLRLSEE